MPLSTFKLDKGKERMTRVEGPRASSRWAALTASRSMQVASMTFMLRRPLRDYFQCLRFF